MNVIPNGTDTKMPNHRKKFIIINGTIGSGKTTVSKALYKEMENCIWLDGDWCWMMNPFIPNDYNKKMVVDNIGFLLRNFMKNPTIEYIILSWVIHLEEIYNTTISELKDYQFDLLKVTLQCNDNEITRRITSDIKIGERTEENLSKSLSMQTLYHNLSSTKIDTSKMTIKEVVQKIKSIVGKGHGALHL